MTRRLRGALASAVTAALAAGLATAVSPVQAAPVVAHSTSWDDDRAAAEARQRANENAMAELEEHLEDTSAELIEAQAELEGIQAAIPVAEAQLAAAETRLAELQREAAIIAGRLQDAEALEASLTQQIEESAARTEEIRTAIGRMARDAYQGEMTASSLSAVLDAQSTEEFVEQSALASTALRTQTQALREMEQLAGVTRNQEARQQAVREEITVLKAEADAKVAEAERARQAAEDRRDELEDLRAAQERALAVIEAKRDEQLAKQRQLEQQRAALEADLTEIIRKQEQERARLEAEQRAREEAERRAREEAERKAREAAGNSGGGAAAPAPPPPAPAPGRPFTNPTSTRPMYKTSNYGMRFHPVLYYWRMHSGTDLRAYCGTPIYAAASGTVQWAYYRGGYGNQVMVNHGYWNGSSLMSSYNHLSGFAVGAGATVARGQLIGYSGNTGMSAACHLHFEAYVNGATTDPWPMLTN